MRKRSLSLAFFLLAAALPALADGAAKPRFANASCPIMAKPVSAKLFAQTVHGRIYVCCKECIADITGDVEASYATAYPEVETHANDTCPVTGEKLGADAVAVSIQGHTFKVKDAAAAKAAADHPEETLAKLIPAKEPAKEGAR